MKRLIASFALFLALVFCSLATAEAGAAMDQIQRRGVLIVGTSTDFPPLSFRTADGRIVGLEIDLANMMARAMNVNLEIVPMPFYELSLEITSIVYNKATGSLEVTYRNPTGLAEYFKSTITIRDGDRIIVIGDDDALFLQRGVSSFFTCHFAARRRIWRQEKGEGPRRRAPVSADAATGNPVRTRGWGRRWGAPAELTKEKENGVAPLRA